MRFFIWSICKQWKFWFFKLNTIKMSIKQRKILSFDQFEKTLKHSSKEYTRSIELNRKVKFTLKILIVLIVSFFFIFDFQNKKPKNALKIKQKCLFSNDSFANEKISSWNPIIIFFEMESKELKINQNIWNNICFDFLVSNITWAWTWTP